MSAKGLSKTLIWTQLLVAIKEDYGVELPNKSGPKTTALIDEISAMLFPEEKPKPTPVMKNGKMEEFIVRVAGKPFRCNCGCNVFHKPDDTDLELYQCNACGEQYRGE